MLSSPLPVRKLLLPKATLSKSSISELKRVPIGTLFLFQNFTLSQSEYGLHSAFTKKCHSFKLD